jgi:hypothetical protein
MLYWNFTYYKITSFMNEVRVKNFQIKSLGIFAKEDIVKLCLIVLHVTPK